MADIPTISSLVLTLGPDAGLRQELDTRLAGDSRFTIGEQRGRRLALISEDTDARAAKETVQWLSDLPEVEFVDVIAIHLDPDQGEGERAV